MNIMYSLIHMDKWVVYVVGTQGGIYVTIGRNNIHVKISFCNSSKIMLQYAKYYMLSK